jgi:hypothetical protein
LGIVSNEKNLTLGGLATKIFGIIILALGLLISYFAVSAESGIVSLKLFTPIGIIVAIIGGLMAISRDY